MSAYLKSHASVIFILLLLTMLVLTWQFPAARFMIEAICLLFSFVTASLIVVAKNRKSYQQGRLTQHTFVRSNIFDILSILLAMTLAGLLAQYVAQMMMALVVSELIRIGVVLMLSLLTGVGIGLLMKRIRRQILTS